MSGNDKVRVLVVDDHPLLREGIAAVLAGKPDLAIVGEAGDGAEAIKRFRALQPDVTVMDLQMPGMSGIDAMRAIRHEAPTARIVMLTTSAGDFLALRALKAGAFAYVHKERVGTELADIIRAVHRGMKRIEPAISPDKQIPAVSLDTFMPLSLLAGPGKKTPPFGGGGIKAG